MKERHQESRQRHLHHIQGRNAVPTSVLYNTTTTTTTTSVHLLKTSVRMGTSWPLASTSTTSTSKMEHATCSTSHNHDFLHLPSFTVHRQHSQSGHVNSGPTSTSASLSTSSLFDFAYDAEEPLTTDIMVLQTATGARERAEILRHQSSHPSTSS